MNRSMAYVESMGGWFDIEEALDANYGYGAMGYFMTAVETEKGQPWIKLLDSATEGTIEVGDSAQVKFHIEAARAYSDQSRATLVVKSNDPMQRVVNYHITPEQESGSCSPVRSRHPHCCRRRQHRGECNCSRSRRRRIQRKCSGRKTASQLSARPFFQTRPK